MYKKLLTNRSCAIDLKKTRDCKVLHRVTEKKLFLIVWVCVCVKVCHRSIHAPGIQGCQLKSSSLTFFPQAFTRLLDTNFALYGLFIFLKQCSYSYTKYVRVSNNIVKKNIINADELSLWKKIAWPLLRANLEVFCRPVQYQLIPMEDEKVTQEVARPRRVLMAEKMISQRFSVNELSAEVTPPCLPPCNRAATKWYVWLVYVYFSPFFQTPTKLFRIFRCYGE